MLELVARPVPFDNEERNGHEFRFKLENSLPL